jgi:hypothetical protein
MENFKEMPNPTIFIDKSGEKSMTIYKQMSDAKQCST